MAPHGDAAGGGKQEEIGLGLCVACLALADGAGEIDAARRPEAEVAVGSYLTQTVIRCMPQDRQVAVNLDVARRRENESGARRGGDLAGSGTEIGRIGGDLDSAPDMNRTCAG